MYGSEQVVDLCWPTHRGRTEIPSSICRDGHRDVGYTDAGNLVAVRVNLRNQVRQHLHAAVPYLTWSGNGPRVGNCRDGRKPHGGKRASGSVGEFRITAFRRRDALARPLVETAKQGAHDLALRHRIVHHLPACARRRECGLAVLGTREQIDSNVVWNSQVSLPVRTRVNERSGAATAPILHGCVREEDLRALLGTVLLKQGTTFAGEGLFVSGERESSSVSTRPSQRRAFRIAR